MQFALAGSIWWYGTKLHANRFLLNWYGDIVRFIIAESACLPFPVQGNGIKLWMPLWELSLIDGSLMCSYKLQSTLSSCQKVWVAQARWVADEAGVLLYIKGNCTAACIVVIWIYESGADSCSSHLRNWLMLQYLAVWSQMSPTAH